MKQGILLGWAILPLLVNTAIAAPSSSTLPPQSAQSTPLTATINDLPEEYAAFCALAEEALALRAETITVGKRLLEQQRQGIPLSGSDLALINEGVTRHLALRARLLQFANAHTSWLNLSGKDLQKAGLSVEQHQQGVALSLAAALVLYDNYLLAISLFEGDSKLRRLLNQSDPAYAIRSAELDRVTRNYNAIDNRERVRRAIDFFEHAAVDLHHAARSHSELDYVITLIEQSPSYSMVKERSPLYVVGRKLGSFGAVTGDTLAEFEREGVSLFSMVFGNAVGLVETRKGKLLRRSDVAEAVRYRLRSGDILLEKTPFRLTDKLIPGYWGHAAVWVGSETELRDLGIWDDPVLLPYQDEIRNGRQIVEALRSGVEINPLEQFLNVDSLGIVRYTAADQKTRAQVVLQALRQIGKPYDFNFDVESKERVYCSKLVYLAYGDLDWPTKKSFGRTTFTPDDVAARALRGDDLELVAFYHDGQQISERPRESMARLMGTAGGAPPSMGQR